MPEQVLFEYERRTDAAEIAEVLRTVADNLERGDDLSFESGSDSITVSPPSRPSFEITVERETSRSGGPAELGLEFELEWSEGESAEGDDAGLTVD